MRRLVAGQFAGAVGLLAAACSGWQAYPPAVGVALAPKATLGLPLHESYRHWLLLSESGWCGASAARWGGTDNNPGVVVVRAAVFKDSLSATDAYHRLTPSFIHRSLRSEMVREPWPTEYPEPLPGERVSVYAYDVRLPPVSAPELRIYGQITTIQAGRAVFLIESIGVPPEQFVPAMHELVKAADSLPRSGC